MYWSQVTTQEATMYAMMTITFRFATPSLGARARCSRPPWRLGFADPPAARAMSNHPTVLLAPLYLGSMHRAARYVRRTLLRMVAPQMEPYEVVAPGTGCEASNSS